MPKRQMSTEESFDLRQAMHVAILEALLTSRRWEPGQLVFHGGTSLHLAHSSPRYSEDLDFMIGLPLRSGDLASAVRARLGRPIWIPDDIEVSIERVREEGSMRTFVVSLGGGNVMGKVKVKVELWQTAPEALATIRTVVSPVRLSRGPGSEVNPHVPTAEAEEILADKVFAMGGRPFTKSRDVFDIHWLVQQGTRRPDARDLATRFAIYNVGGRETWLRTATGRRQELLADQGVLAEEIRPWLPSYWPLTEETVREMVATTVEVIDHGAAIVAGLMNADRHEGVQEDRDAPGMSP